MLKLSFHKLWSPNLTKQIYFEIIFTFVKCHSLCTLSENILNPETLLCSVPLTFFHSGGALAAIISSVGVAVLGAASSYFAYQKKKLCFKIQGGEFDTYSAGSITCKHKFNFRFEVVEKEKSLMLRNIKYKTT